MSIRLPETQADFAQELQSLENLPLSEQEERTTRQRLMLLKNVRRLLRAELPYETLQSMDAQSLDALTAKAVPVEDHHRILQTLKEMPLEARQALQAALTRQLRIDE